MKIHVGLHEGLGLYPVQPADVRLELSPEKTIVKHFEKTFRIRARGSRFRGWKKALGTARDASALIGQTNRNQQHFPPLRLKKLSYLKYRKM
jgi:hypothetical protein